MLKLLLPFLMAGVVVIDSARAQTVHSLVDLVTPADPAGPPPPVVVTPNGSSLWGTPRQVFETYEWGTIPSGPFAGRAGYFLAGSTPSFGEEDGFVVADGSRVALRRRLRGGSFTSLVVPVAAPPGSSVRARFTVRNVPPGFPNAQAFVQFIPGVEWTSNNTFSGATSGWLEATVQPGTSTELRVSTFRTDLYVEAEIFIRIGAPFDGETLGQPFGLAEVEPNSQGRLARLGAFGSSSLAASDVVLQVDQLQPLTFGLIVASQSTAVRPLQGGTLLLGDPVTRLGPGAFAVAPDGAATLPLDLSQPVIGTPAGRIRAGESWSFQAWYRDGPSSNLTSGVTIAFTP